MLYWGFLGLVTMNKRKFCLRSGSLFPRLESIRGHKYPPLLLIWFLAVVFSMMDNSSSTFIGSMPCLCSNLSPNITVKVISLFEEVLLGRCSCH
jgi:hypothetical protein